MEMKSKRVFVRIPLQNIKLEDSYEQSKIDRMKSTDPDKVIDYFEDTLKDIVITISFN